MSRESEQWAEDRRNGTLDDPIDSDWIKPNCCKCNKFSTLVVTPCGSRGYGSIELGAPYAEGSVYYCRDHYPENCK